MSTSVLSKNDMWSRKYYTKPYEPAFVFFAIYGVENAELELSKSRHNVDGFPEGLDIIFYHKDESNEQKEYIEEFLKGVYGNLLKEKSPELYQKSQQSKSMTIVTGTFEDSDNLNYLKNVIGVIKALSEKKAISVLDVQNFEFYTPEEWSTKYFLPHKLQINNHAILFFSQETGRLWIHSRGMRTFGRPDVSLVDWPIDKMEIATDVANRFIKMYALGQYPENNVPIKIKGLPNGMTTNLKGGYDNHDFNNYFIEVKWNNN